MSYLWTSEAVASGHPDKVADQVADAILDAHLAVDPLARVACEVTMMRDLVLVTGEVSSNQQVNIEEVTRRVICGIGYDRDETCFNGNTVPILNKMNRQSPEIAKAVIREDGEIGAGDQGLMFGYACNETINYMPSAHYLAFRVIDALEMDRKKNPDSILLPDAKSQVTMRYYDSGSVEDVDTILVSTQYKPGISLPGLRSYVNALITKQLDKEDAWPNTSIKTIVNPGGEWHVGGPAADTGLSGRKIVVDNYGADCPIGGGSFSGKDPTKVDRSAAYAARHLAKNIVAANRATCASVQIAYGIGMVEPISIRIQSGNILSDQQLMKLVKQVKLSPKAIIDRFQLRRPIYQATASGGHFGRSEFPWEQLTLLELFTINKE
jgi:S-adenosylmethionine synthetase